MLRNANIVCFAKDWSEDPTSNNHVMRMLARDNRVLWLNSIATRTPKLSSGRDWAKMGRKLRSFAAGPQRVDAGLSVFTPMVLPLPHVSAAVALNRRLLRATTRHLRRRLDMERFQLWSFLPTAVEYFGKMDESFGVYYCTDEWSQFSNVDGARIAEMERELCRRADVVFTTSRSLWQRKRLFNPETHLALHGVDWAHFASALAPETPLAPELADLKGPVLGFFGLIHDWIDLELLAYLADARPSWNLVMIGKVAVDISRLRKYPNIHWLGRRAYAELPRYCKGFSLGLIPFAMSELTRNVNPIKLREYASAGLPVISTALPECAEHPDWCSVADNPEQFLIACETALASDSPAARERRSELMRAESWENKVKQLGEHIVRIQAGIRVRA